jgi:DNA-binding beta-propeller fold protein YncE
VAINGRFVYVANKALDPLHTITTLPNYTTFTVDGSGRLTQVPFGQVQVAAGSSPSQVLVSNDQRYLFATDFLAFMLPTEMTNPIGTLLSFSLEGTGGLKLAAGAPYSVPTGDGGALGLAQNPRSQTLYVGFPVASAFRGLFYRRGDGCADIRNEGCGRPGHLLAADQRTRARGCIR